MVKRESGRPEDVERLRREIARVKARNAELESRAREAPAGRGGWRRALAAILVVAGAAALVGALPAVWARNVVLDTDRYVTTVAPLASSPAIQRSVADTAVDRLFGAADIEARVRQVLPPQGAVLAPTITSQLRSISDAAAIEVMRTDQFRMLWVEANRRAHEVVLPVLLGKSGPKDLLDTSRGTVSVDVSAIVARVKSALVDRGVSFVEDVPDDIGGGRYVIFHSERLAAIQDYVRTLQTLAWVLPVLALVAFAGGVLASPDRRLALLWVGVAVVVAMIVLGAGLAFARSYYLDSVDRAVLDGAAAGAFFDIMVRFLRNALRTVAALGAVLAVGAVLAGPSSAAVALRRGAANGIGGITSALGLDLGPFSAWVERYRRGIEIVALLLLAAVLFASSRPTPGLVLGLAAAALLVFASVELLARARPGPPPQPTA